MKYAFLYENVSSYRFSYGELDNEKAEGENLYSTESVQKYNSFFMGKFKLAVETEYDQELRKFSAFDKRPFLLPHVGSRLIKDNAVLLILESHYVDPSFFGHQYDQENLKEKAPELFYNIQEDKLTNAFKEYIHTRRIIRDSMGFNNVRSNGNSVYTKLSKVIEKGLNIKVSDGCSPLDYVAIYNYFQRPSYKHGRTIDVCEKDKTIAYDALRHILKTIAFKKVIFLSIKSYDYFNSSDRLHENQITEALKVYRGSHPRIWGNRCAYDRNVTWKEWVIARLNS